jgi:pimeloyl-ACP methyl ester carboxylesterase
MLNEVRHHTVQANGIRVHVAEQGEGPLVLLVHGFPELWYSWRHQIPALAAAGYRVAAIDQRGYGRSSKLWDPSRYSISHLVADVVGVVEALGETSAVIVGHDWGAPVAWTAAWQHPTIFRAVAGLSVPFSGRGLVALPGSPFGEVPPNELHARIAGEGRDFYQDYFATLGPVIDEIEQDLRGWYRDLVWSFSGDAPLPPELVGVDLSRVDPVEIIRKSGVCIAHGAKLRANMGAPPRMPAWFTEADLSYFVDEFERTGFAGGLAYYRALQTSWEELAPMVGKPLTVPSLFIGGDRDVATFWGTEAIVRSGEHLKDLRGVTILPGCGHWVQQEKAEETNQALLAFLAQLGG